MQTIRRREDAPQAALEKTPYQLALENHLASVRKQALITLVEQLEAFIEQTAIFYRQNRDANSTETLTSIKSEITNNQYQPSSTKLTTAITKIMQDRYYVSESHAAPYLSALKAIEASCEIKTPDPQPTSEEDSLTARASFDTDLATDVANPTNEEQTPTYSLYDCFTAMFSSNNKTLPLPQDDADEDTQNQQTQEQQQHNKIFNGQLARQLNNIIAQWENIKKEKQQAIPKDRLLLINKIKNLGKDSRTSMDPNAFIAQLLKLKSELMKASESRFGLFSSNKLYRMLEVGFPYTKTDLNNQLNDFDPYFYEALLATLKELTTSEITMQYKTHKKDRAADIKADIEKTKNINALATFLKELISTEKTGMHTTDLDSFSNTLQNKNLSNMQRNTDLTSLIQQAKFSLAPPDPVSRSLSNGALHSPASVTAPLTAPISITQEFYSFILGSLGSKTICQDRFKKLIHCENRKSHLRLTSELSRDGYVINAMTKFDSLIKKTQSPFDREFYYSTMLLFLYARSKVIEDHAGKDATLECTRAILQMVLRHTTPGHQQNFVIPKHTPQNQIDIDKHGDHCFGYIKNDFGKIVKLIETKFLAQSEEFKKEKVASCEFFTTLVEGTVPEDSNYLRCT